jgi:hypothetical protein
MPLSMPDLNGYGLMWKYPPAHRWSFQVHTHHPIFVSPNCDHCDILWPTHRSLRVSQHICSAQFCRRGVCIKVANRKATGSRSWPIPSRIHVVKSHMGMDQYLLIPFFGGWTSIYQLFWCSPGVQGFDTLPHLNNWRCLILGRRDCNRKLDV